MNSKVSIVCSLIFKRLVLRALHYGIHSIVCFFYYYYIFYCSKVLFSGLLGLVYLQITFAHTLYRVESKKKHSINNINTFLGNLITTGRPIFS